MTWLGHFSDGPLHLPFDWANMVGAFQPVSGPSRPCGNLKRRFQLSANDSHRDAILRYDLPVKRLDLFYRPRRHVH
jgi:hypothetical protein